MYKKLILLILLVLLSGCVNNSDNNKKDESAIVKKNFLINECQYIGGEVVSTDGDRNSKNCPEGKEYLGDIYGVWCICICCK